MEATTSAWWMSRGAPSRPAYGRPNGTLGETIRCTDRTAEALNCRESDVLIIRVECPDSSAACGHAVAVDLDATVLSIARGLVAADAGERAMAADEVTDIINDLDLGRLTSWRTCLFRYASPKTTRTPKRAQLLALWDWVSGTRLPSGATQAMAHVPPEIVTGSQQE